MSASEKLKALEMNMGGFHTPLVVKSYVSALPQIVAVVEAAQNAQQILPKSAGSVAEWNSITHIERALTDALAALDEQLPDLGVATDSESPTLR